MVDAGFGTREAYFDVKDEASISYRTNFIITKSEIDGLRVIRIFDNYDMQNCSIIRNSPQAYQDVKRSFTNKPVFLLYEGYQSFVEKKPIQEQDIRQVRSKLVEAVNDLIDCGCFELDPVDNP